MNGDQIRRRNGRRPGSTRYKILRVLGRGGMGVVYHAVQVDLQREVALKLIRSRLLLRKRTLLRFQREVRALAKLNHPNLVKFYDYKTAGENHYIAMEYIDGPDLNSWIKINERPGRETILGFGRDIASAMVYFHAQGLIHRDLKPRNVLISSDGRARVTDFGLSKHLDLSSITAMGVKVGTPRYMSPEIARAQSIDHRTDIYQWGLTMYELATGQPAHRGGSVKEVVECCLKNDIIPPSGLNPDLDPDVESLIMKCLSFDRERRFRNSSELLREINRLGRQSAIVRLKKEKERLKLGGRYLSGLLAGAGSRLSVPTVILAAICLATAFFMPGVSFFTRIAKRPRLTRVKARAGVSDCVLTWASDIAFVDKVSYRREGPEGGRTRICRTQGEATRIHRVVLTDLVPGEKYSWWIHLPGGDRSIRYSFRTRRVKSRDWKTNVSSIKLRVDAAFEKISSGDPVELLDGLDELSALDGDGIFSYVADYLSSPVNTERTWAASVLARIDGNRALPFLVPLLADRAQSVRMAAALSIGCCCPPRDALGAMKYLSFFSRSSVREALAAALGALPGKAPVNLLYSLASDPVGKVRLRALQGLARSEAFPLAAKAAGFISADPVIRRQVVDTLGIIGNPCVLDELHRAIKLSDPLTGAHILVALARLEGVDCLPLLKERLVGKTRAVRLGAIIALGEIPGHRSLRLLKSSYKGCEPALRPAVIRSVGRLDLPGACSFLLHLLVKAPQPEKVACLLALGEGTFHRAVPNILGSLDNEIPSIRAAAAVALVWSGENPKISRLELALRCEKDTVVSQSMLRALLWSRRYLSCDGLLKLRLSVNSAGALVEKDCFVAP